MVTPFETAILKMKEFGMFQFLFPFMLSAAIFYGLLRKSQIFGDPNKNVAINAVVALVAAFMVWSYPILAGVDVETQLTNFFTQGMSATLIILLGLLISSMFFKPDLAEQLSALFPKGSKVWSVVLIAGILIGGGILLSSGMINVFIPQATGGLGGIGGLSEDTILTIGVVLLLAVTVVVVVFAGGK